MNPRTRKNVWIAGFALLAVSAAIGGQSLLKTSATHAALPPDHKASVSYANQLSTAFRETAASVMPAVVAIESQPEVAKIKTPKSGFNTPSRDPFEGSPFGQLFNDPQLRKFFEQSPSHPDMPEGGGRASLGSGVIIDPSGIILTNNHVVKGAGKVTVHLSDGREYVASDIKTDPKTDLAILRIKGAKNLRTAKLGDSDSVEIGDWVLALGQPFGLQGTVTAGIISAKHRGIGIVDRENFLQTDAAINPGNSGGPLVDLNGHVIGINTAISTRSGGNNGVGFAVPVNLVKWVTSQLEKAGVVRRSYLGVGIQPVNFELSSKLGVQPNEGVAVTQVFPNTPAAKAGLQDGDVIVEFGGQPVKSVQQLQMLVERNEVGHKAAMKVVRNGKPVSLTVTGEAQPSDFGLAGKSSPQKSPSQPEQSSAFGKMGLEVGALSADVAKKLGLQDNNGVVITSVTPGSPAEAAGLTEGMAIVQIDHHNVTSVDEANAAADKASLKDGVLMLVRAGKGSQFVVLEEK